MTVAELIKQLQKMPQDREVLLELNSGTVWGKALSVGVYCFKENGEPYGEVVITNEELSIPEKPSFMF